MTDAVAALAFVPGLAIGSFLNVVAARIPARLSIVAPRSCCPACAAEIAWYDNVPIVSYLLLRGRCRACSARISAKYPLVELATAALVSACILDFGLSAGAAISAVFCAVLVVVTVTDLERRVIPNRVVLPAAASCWPRGRLVHHSPAWAIAAAAGSLFLLLAALAYPGGMGMGDVKLALLLGAALGTHAPGRADGRDALRARPRRSAPGAPRQRRHGRWRFRSGRSSPPAAWSRSLRGTRSSMPI